MSETPQVCFVTDSGLLVPTVFSMWSMLCHVSRPVDLHFWGDQLSENEWELVRRVAQSKPNHKLYTRCIDPEDLAGSVAPAAHISAAAMGRLFIPRHISGRVLYIDGDTVIGGDITPLFKMELNTCVGAVRDFVTAKWTVQKEYNNPRQRARLDYVDRHLPSGSYFNSGVMILNCDRIRANPALMMKMEDVAAASATEWGDQDHLNFLFHNEVTLLNPSYNSSWQRTRRQRQFSASLGGALQEQQKIPEVIIHFHGPRKPWKKALYDLWSQRARAVFHYRRKMREFTKEFPDAVF